MHIYEMLLLEKVPKLNFTVSHILVSYPLVQGGTYKIDDTDFNVYYLYTRARSETFPMILLVHNDINLSYPCGAPMSCNKTLGELKVCVAGGSCSGAGGLQ